MWHERTSPLDQVLPTDFGRRKGERNEGEEEEEDKERESIFSLYFSGIDSSDLDETRIKVGLHGKGYVWVPVLWSFNNSGRYRSSPTWLFLV